MLRTGEGASADVTDRGGKDFLAHGTRNKGIRFTVDNENRKLGIGNGLRRIGFSQTKTAIQPRAQYQERFYQLSRDAHPVADIANDRHRSIIRTIRYDPFHLMG